MNERGFRNFLGNEGLTDKAINSRITRGNRIEKEFDVSLDYIVQSEENMLEIRRKIYEKYEDMKSLPGNLYNVASKYYKYKNGKEMPRVNSIRR